MITECAFVRPSVRPSVRSLARSLARWRPRPNEDSRRRRWRCRVHARKFDSPRGQSGARTIGSLDPRAASCITRAPLAQSSGPAAAVAKLARQFARDDLELRRAPHAPMRAGPLPPPPPPPSPSDCSDLALTNAPGKPLRHVRAAARTASSVGARALARPLALGDNYSGSAAPKSRSAPDESQSGPLLPARGARPPAGGFH